jgi:hypothetical protein
VTVTLRRDTGRDLEWLKTWLPAVAKSVGDDLDIDGAFDSLFVDIRIIRRAKTDVGAIVFETREPKYGSAIIRVAATPPEFARQGSCMAAIPLLENELARRGVRVVYAPASAVHGIAMYFWIRLGYRPLLRAEWPCERDGVAWLMRRIDP